MAAKHKAATEVTVAPRGERTAFQDFVHRHWPKGAAIAVIVGAAILFTLHHSRSAVEARRASWASLDAAVGSLFGELPPAPELRELAEEHAGEVTGPWVLVLEVTKLVEERDYVGAKAALDRLETTYPGHPAVTREFHFGEDEPPRTVADFVAERIGALEVWERGREGLFDNPPLPEDAPRVKLETSAGPIVVGLYEERAPKHVENFLKLVGEGFYAGTKFHRVVPGFMIQGGDPNTREGERSTWGQGGPGYKVEAETEGGLRHFEGYLAAAKTGGDVESSGSQFYITTGSPHHLDGQHTVFGKLLEGEEVVEAIERGETRPEDDQPVDPVEILSAETM